MAEIVSPNFISQNISVCRKLYFAEVLFINIHIYNDDELLVFILWNCLFFFSFLIFSIEILQFCSSANRKFLRNENFLSIEHWARLKLCEIIFCYPKWSPQFSWFSGNSWFPEFSSLPKYPLPTFKFRFQVKFSEIDIRGISIV